MRRSSASRGLALALALALPLAMATTAGALPAAAARPRLGNARSGLRALLRDLDERPAPGGSPRLRGARPDPGVPADPETGLMLGDLERGREAAGQAGRPLHPPDQEAAGDGRQVIPSFGGYSADQDGTEIADSCRSVPKIARAYESVVTTYGVTRLDMDVEANSLNNGRDRAAQRGAGAAAGLGRPDPPPRGDHLHPGRRAVGPARQLPGRAQECRLPRRPVHREHHGLRLLHQGQQDRHRDGQGRDHGPVRDARQLAQLYPHPASAALGHRGHNDPPGDRRLPEEDRGDLPGRCPGVARFARAHGLPQISIWAIQRDNGGCPGAIDSNSCSGIKQPPWAFSHLLDN